MALEPETHEAAGADESRGAAKAEAAPQGGLASALKDQLALLSFLVLFGGIVSTNTYYAAFGVQYQLLDLPIPHLIYRGLTAIIQSWPLLLAYVLAMSWLAVGADLMSARGPSWAKWMPLVTYGLILLVVAVSYFAAIAAGRNSAQDDLLVAKSQLPIIQSMTSAKGAPMPFAKYRLLSAGKDRVAVFMAVGSRAEYPNIHILKLEDISEITLSPPPP